MAPTRRMIAASLGKMPTTSVPRLMSPFNRSSGLALWILARCSLGNVVKAMVLVQIDWQTRLVVMAVRRCRIYSAASTAFQMAGALRSLRHGLSRLNCPLWMPRNSSMPAIVIAPVLNHLNLSIGSMRSFTPR